MKELGISKVYVLRAYINQLVIVLGFGSSVIQRLVKTSVKQNLYYEIKERPVEEKFDGYRVNRVNKFVKVFGLNSDKATRAQLIDLLVERSQVHRDKFVAEIIYNEMSKMVVKATGKVEHSDKSHDDQVFSLLMALYVWYFGHNIMENFGIQKNVIQSDDMEDIESIEGGIADQTMEYVDLDQNPDDRLQQELESQMQYIKEAGRFMLNSDFAKQLYDNDQEQINMQLANNPLFRKAYNEQYHSDIDANYRPLTRIPDEVFLTEDDDDYEQMRRQQFNGNLYDSFVGAGGTNRKLW